MKKVLYAILAVLLIAGFCIGSAAAFTVDSSKVTVNPSGSLSPGDTVSAVITIDVPKSSEASFSFTTPLEKASWHVDLVMGGITMTYLDLSGKTASPAEFWTNTYDDPYSLKITMNGKVGNDLAGNKIRAATIIQSGGKASDLSTYSTPEQTVYNPATITASIAALRAEIATIKDESVFYATFGIDVTAATDKIASAESYLKNAETYLASNNLNAAYTALDNAEKAVESAGRGLAQLALDRIYSDISSIKGIIDQLLEKNWTNEATILTSKLTEVSSNYNLLNTEYNNNGIPDCRQTLQAAEDLNAQANEYLIKSESAPQFLQYWWVLLIVLGVAAVVVGVIFIIRRRGGGGWDELG
ncbi:MAG TPA: hypothetical protein O0X39_01980 [Methanocorpusculum sp.]|nr:hypothetical protein [Methanocorpusculum sp.]